MSKYTFRQLTDQLPNCERFPTNINLPSGVSYGNTITEFVPPNVSHEAGDLDNSEVLIIAAPGAVGKSTLARALSSEKGALIWDLAEAEEVGSGSLDAMLDYAIQTGLKPEFLQWMSAGIQCIIIDALDEGRIKVNENSFSRLLENISRLAKDAQGICFVLLGRTQIAESVWLSLEDHNTKASILTIEPFTREQANEYIAKRVESRGIELLNECRDLIFQQLETAMKDGSNSEAISDFLHYPPVLDVISVLLNRERNLMAAKNFLEGQAPETSVKLLRDVINHIMEREQKDKIVAAFLDKLSTRDRAGVTQCADALYTSEEQGMRLLSNVLGISIDCTPDALPNYLETTYAESVDLALTEHPFLRGSNQFANGVFESYLYAQALRGEYGDVLTSRVEDVLSRSPGLPKTHLAEFYLGAGSHGSVKLQQVRPEHLGLLYDSFLSTESRRRRVRLSIDGSEPGQLEDMGVDHADGEFELVFGKRDGDNSFESQIIPFSLELTKDSTISFRRYIRDVHLTVGCTVELGRQVGEFKIGPSVHVDAEIIRIGAEALVIDKVPPSIDEYGDTGVTLEAQAIDASRLRESPTVFSSDFSVTWPGDEVFPWRRYRRDTVLPDLDDELTQRIYQRFRRIATAFQSRGKGTLARTREKIDHRRITRGELERCLVSTLLGDGILYLGDGGRRYYWAADNANELLGVSWTDLRNYECPEKLQQYLREFKQDHPEL